MASHGGAGNKFVSVNLNKSFGQSAYHRNHNHPSHQNGSYGQATAGRARSAGGGDGMVVLSRPRSSQKAAPKLSVPPPLNLPSLRKEHEKFDLSGSGSGSVGGAGSGSGSRPNVSSVGWMKPGAIALQEKEGGGDTMVADGTDQTGRAIDGIVKGSSSYVPPSARLAGVGVPVTASGQSYLPPAEKAMFLRGEDFPSLKAALPPTTSGPVQKQRDNSHQKQQGVGEESSNEQRNNNRFNSPLHMRPQGQYGNVLNENGGQGRRFGGSQMADQAQKQEDYPLPLVHLNPRSDWADDERDTGYGFAEWGKEPGFTKTEAFWDRDFDMPRNNILPQKLPHNKFERWGSRGNETEKGTSGEVLKTDPYHGDVRTPSWEGNNWRSSPLQRDGFNTKEVVNDRNASAQPTGLNRDSGRENKYIPPTSGDRVRNGGFTGNGESALGRRDTGHGQVGRQNWNHMVESSTQLSKGKDGFGAEQSTRYRADSFQNRTFSKSSFSSGGKGLPDSDPILSFGRDKRPLSNSDRPFSEDPLLKDFDERDPFSGGLVGVIKRKKDVVKQADFHDPVRESFEAELERVQRMQEMERQRIIEEQERVLEQARREEEERQRHIREEEERRIRLEEEAREAAWRAEQEQLEVIRMAEEQKIAREEEKKRILFEEERRKQAAKQKLLELEAKIAQRRAEAEKGDMSASVKEKDVFESADLDDWEDSERMVERITTSASSDSSVLNGPFVTSSRFPPSGESSGYLDRGKSVNSWRRDPFDNGNSSSFALKDQDNGHQSPRQDSYFGGRAFPRKEFYGGYGDSFYKDREIGSEAYENVSERYGDAAWGQGHTRGNPHSLYPERLYPTSEVDELYPYGRSRFSMRQPRVLPPPSIASMQKNPNYVASGESALRREYYDESDESGDSPAMPASAEEKDISLSGHGSVVLKKSGKDTMMTASSSLSACEDEEWTLEKNEGLQEQEEYDEDGYQEEDEVHEVDDENIDLTHEFEDLHLEDKGSSHVMDNLVLGFDEGVEVGLPSDEFESNPPKSEGNKIDMPEVSVGIIEDQGVVDGTQADRERLEPVDCSPQTNTENASSKIDGAEKAILESVIQPINDPPTSVAADPLSSTNTSSGSGLSVPLTVPSSVTNQADSPFTLQFGLFTGPSLIPSPVPAIQIGSIQMPLHLHLPVDPSITHLQPSQPHLFQFGQLRYPSPISQGILPMPPQSMSFVQPNIQHHYSYHNSGGSLPVQPGQDTLTNNKLVKDDVSSISMKKEPAVVSSSLDLAHNTGTENQHAFNNQHISESVFEAEDKERKDSVFKNLGQPDEKEPEGPLQSAAVAASPFISREKNFNISKGQGPPYGNRAKKLPYSVRNYGLKSSFSTPEASRSDSIGFQRRPRRPIQRTEFRVRQSSGLVPSNNSGFDDKSDLNSKDMELSNRSGLKRGTMPTKTFDRVVESESVSSGPSNTQDMDSRSKVSKGNMKRNISEENVDAPSQIGVVHVYQQSGIEGPSDEDDFIEVRSKRQMLNDRREQREKEIKAARSRVTKQPRKPRSLAQSSVGPTNSNKLSASLGRESSKNTRTDFRVSGGHGIVNKEVTTGFTPMASQQLAPIGTPTANTNVQADIKSHTKSLQTVSAPAVSGVGNETGPGLIFETKNKVLDTVQTPLDSWGNARINQQVMALTQTQLDEAMKPVRFETHGASIGGHTTLSSEPMLASSSTLTKDTPISSSTSPINSLLAGEKIQFGAVTSPTVLPPSSSRVVSNGIGAPGSFRSDSRNISKDEMDSTLFFEKDKCPDESCAHLEDCEDEAEAAASAVAVAAITSEKIAGNGLSSVSNSDAKNFGGAEGLAGDQKSGTQSRVEESLSVSLPADLSVETPPISLWPPLPSPQNSSTQMLPHFPGGPASHFPFYEVNPMLGGPIFAFSPHEESGRTQSQTQNNSTVSGQGHSGTWQQCHHAMDSFYSPPAGFTGPFISPPGGIPGVQVPPNMVFYNHYARLGQFGQVGLSFMGTTYIPSGKQPDWKHNPTSSGMGIGEGDMNMGPPAQHLRPPNMPLPMQQHLAPGSPLLPMVPPLTMFDVSPFQAAPDMSVQARWPHIPAAPLHTAPLSLPLDQRPEGVLPFSHGHPVDQSLIGNRFSESRVPATSETGPTFPVVTDAKLGLVDSSSSTAVGPLTQISGESSVANSGKSDVVQNGKSMNSFKPQNPQQKNLSSQNYSHSTGYGYQRGGGSSQRTSSAGEWSHRRMGSHGRNHSLGAEKNFPTSKVRQVYVPKQISGVQQRNE